MSRRQRYRQASLVRGTGRRPDRDGYWVQWYEPAGGAGPARPARRRMRLPTRDLARRFAARKTAELNAPLFGVTPWPAMVAAFEAHCGATAAATQEGYARTLGGLRDTFRGRRLKPSRMGGDRRSGRRDAPQSASPRSPSPQPSPFKGEGARGSPSGQSSSSPRPSAFEGEWETGPSNVDITSDLVQKYFEQRRAAGAGVATLRKDLRNLRVFIRFGLRREPPWFARDVSLAINLGRAPQRLIRRPSIDDVAALLNAACRLERESLNWWLAIRLGFETGLRLNDVVGLTWGELRYEETPKRRNDGTTEHPHPNPLPSLVINTLNRKAQREGLWCCTAGLEQALELRRETASTTRVLGWARWRPKGWVNLLASAGLRRLRYHDLRGAAATCAAGLAANLEAARRLLDHASSATTRRHYVDQLAWATRWAAALEEARLPPYAPATPTPAAPRPSAAAARP